MQDVFEKIIEKLEERTSFLSDCTKYGNKDAEQQKNSYSTMMMYEVDYLVDDLIEIVKQEAEQYKDLDMEFSKKCVELAEKMNVCDLVAENCRLSNENRFLKLKEFNNGWIPCSERLPEPIRPVLVTLRNWMNDKCFVRVGRFHTDHWKTDEGIVENSVVLAWQPLPEPYQPKGE